jgi:hypothetical protein
MIAVPANRESTMAKAFPLFAIDPQGTLAQNATLMLHTRVAEMYRFGGYVDNVDCVDELHNMRIAAKRLRYTMEIFASAFQNEEFATLYENVKSIQEQIGDIHDCDVRIPLIASFLADLGERRPEIKIGLACAIEAERARRGKLYEKFRRYWLKLNDGGFHHRFLELVVKTEDAVAESAVRPGLEGAPARLAAKPQSDGQAPQVRGRRRKTAPTGT